MGDLKVFAGLLWDEIQKANRDHGKEKQNLKKQLAEVEKKLANYHKAIEAGAEMQYIIEPLNQAGRLKADLEQRMAVTRLPFEGITKKEILAYLKSQRGIKIPRDDVEMCKKIIADHVESATVYDKETIEIVLKYHLIGVPKSGGGGPTPPQALLFCV